MLSKLFPALLLGMLPACASSPSIPAEYRLSYVPEVVDMGHGVQFVVPDTPYVATVGKNRLYFIDTRLNAEAAGHAKKQLEHAFRQEPDEVVSIDETTATAKLKNTVTGETTFEFDPEYARIIFARGINKRNPEIKLPQPEPAGDWLVTYDFSPMFPTLQ